MQTVIIMSYGKASVGGVRNVHGKRDTVSGLHRDRRLIVWVGTVALRLARTFPKQLTGDVTSGHVSVADTPTH